jgi:hypothetical protein
MTRSATSSGLVNRPVSEFDANSAVTCSAVLPLASPSTLVTPSRSAFAALWSVTIGRGNQPLIDPMVTITPKPFSTMTGMATRIARTPAMNWFSVRCRISSAIARKPLEEAWRLSGSKFPRRSGTHLRWS